MSPQVTSLSSRVLGFCAPVKAGKVLLNESFMQRRVSDLLTPSHAFSCVRAQVKRRQRNVQAGIGREIEPPSASES
jgi:hypothetical protein